MANINLIARASAPPKPCTTPVRKKWLNSPNQPQVTVKGDIICVTWDERKEHLGLKYSLEMRSKPKSNNSEWSTWRKYTQMAIVGNNITVVGAIGEAAKDVEFRVIAVKGKDSSDVGTASETISLAAKRRPRSASVGRNDGKMFLSNGTAASKSKKVQINYPVLKTKAKISPKTIQNNSNSAKSKERRTLHNGVQPVRPHSIKNSNRVKASSNEHKLKQNPSNTSSEADIDSKIIEKNYKKNDSEIEINGNISNEDTKKSNDSDHQINTSEIEKSQVDNEYQSSQIENGVQPSENENTKNLSPIENESSVEKSEVIQNENVVNSESNKEEANAEKTLVEAPAESENTSNNEEQSTNETSTDANENVETQDAQADAETPQAEENNELPISENDA